MKFVDSKRSLVVYATDRSKAVVPVLFLFYVALWFILWGASCLVLPSSLSSCLFSAFSIGGRRSWSCAFVCLFCTC